MPNIPGFGAIIAMIFSPCIDLKRNKDGTRYTSVLSGLGSYRQMQRPIFEEHDTTFDLDVVIDYQDIQDVILLLFKCNDKSIRNSHFALFLGQ